MNASFLSQVYSVAKSTASATTKCVDLLKSGNVNWHDAEQVKSLALEFRLGRMAANLGLKTREQALVVNDKSKYQADSKAPDKRRTEAEQRAYRCGVSGWEHIAKLAGMPSRNGGERKPRQTVADVKAKALTEAATKAAPKAQAALKMVAKLTAPASSEADVRDFALEMARVIQAFDKRAGKTRMGAWKMVLADFVAKVHATAKATHPGAGHTSDLSEKVEVEA